MEKEECCKLLGISKNYTKKELKHAYQEMSKKYHPDVVGPQSKQYFIKISVAYKTLMTKFSKKAMQQGGPSQDPKTGREQYKKSLNEIDSETNRKKINQKEFNKQFENSKKNTSNEGFVYDIDQSNYKERTQRQFQQDYDSINREIGNTQPIMGSYNPQNFNNYFEQVKRSNTDIDHYVGVGDYDTQNSMNGPYGQEQTMGMYSVTQNIDPNGQNAVMYEQPLSQQEMQQRMNSYSQQQLYAPQQHMQPHNQQHQPQQPQQHTQNQESELLYQISENQHHILNELKQNKKALNNPEIVDKINEISRKQEQLLKQRFN